VIAVAVPKRKISSFLFKLHFSFLFNKLTTLSCPFLDALNNKSIRFKEITNLNI
jgi:hypothetical protein